MGAFYTIGSLHAIGCMASDAFKVHHLSPLKDLLGFSQEQLRTASISYNPMAFLMAIPVTKWQFFPKHLFQHWVRLALDLPFDDDDCERTCEAYGQTAGRHGTPPGDVCVTRHQGVETRSLARG